MYSTLPPLPLEMKKLDLRSRWHFGSFPTNFSNLFPLKWLRMTQNAKFCKKKKKKERKNNTMLQGNFYERLHFSMDSCTIRPMASLFSIAFMFIPIFLRLEGMPHANKKLEMWQKNFMADLAWPKFDVPPCKWKVGNLPKTFLWQIWHDQSWTFDHSIALLWLILTSSEKWALFWRFWNV